MNPDYTTSHAMRNSLYNLPMWYIWLCVLHFSCMIRIMWRLVPAILLPLAFGAQYPFSASLSKDSFGQPIYQLQWTFDVVQQTITFNVLAKTTGWVGFGLSPNGGMVGSDVVTGWVNDTGAYLQVSCEPTGGGGGEKIDSHSNFHSSAGSIRIRSGTATHRSKPGLASAIW